MRHLDDEASQRVAASYAERLMHSDLAAHVGRALDRADPEIDLLFEAIRGFVAALPAADVMGSGTASETPAARPTGASSTRRTPPTRTSRVTAPTRLIDSACGSPPTAGPARASPRRGRSC